MTPVSDIEKLEQLRKKIDKGAQSFSVHADYEALLYELAPSLIADWKEMRVEIERLTKERDREEAQGAIKEVSEEDKELRELCKKIMRGEQIKMDTDSYWRGPTAIEVILAAALERRIEGEGR